MANDRWNLVSGRVCPVCGVKLKRTDSYSQPGPGHELYHLACFVPALSGKVGPARLNEPAPEATPKPR